MSVLGTPAAPLVRPRAEWAYFLDIDGTLVDVADSPLTVRLDPDMARIVERLYQITDGAVAIISGRSIPDIDALFRNPRMPVAGQHGLERRDARGRVVRHDVASQGLVAARDTLAAAVAMHPGLWLEDKGLSLALHYRRVPRLGAVAHRLARAALEPLGEGYCLQTGKAVVELKPAGKDKGVAVREFMAERPFRGRVPVFVGDDTTDEFGFATVNDLHGHSVKVGPGPTTAQWRLPTVGAVRRWLARVAVAEAE